MADTRDPQDTPASVPNRTSAPVLRLLALTMAVLSIGNALWAAWDQDITYDEPFHLAWPQSLLETRDDSRGQFRLDSKTPALLPAVGIRKALQAGGVESEQVLRFGTRLQSVALLGFVFLLVYRLAQTDDSATGWIGLLLAALDANLAAHASIATTDLAYTVVVLLFVAVVARQGLSRSTALSLGVVLGVGLSVKYTALLLLPLAAARLLAGRGVAASRRVIAAAIAVLSLSLTACTLYLWVGVMSRLDSIPLDSPPLKSLAHYAPSLRLPIPRAILTGIDLSIAHNRPDLWASYVFGAEHRGGVWYYFLANWLMKTPLALAVLTLAGLWRVRARWRTPTVLALGALWLVHFVYFSFFFATQIGLRFALPCVALACALAARGLGPVRPAWLLAAAALAGVERAPYFGDPLAFTSTLVWPKSRAYWYTADSNLDWGQNRDRVARYAREMGQAMIIDQVMVTPGLFVVGANDLAISNRRHSFRFLVERDLPAVRVGFTHFAFSVTGEVFDEYLSAERMASPSSRDDPSCVPPLSHYPPGAQIPFEQNVSPARGRTWAVCVESRKGADIGFTVTAGRAWFGRPGASGGCEADLLLKDQQAWFRVPKATPVRLCLTERPYTRTGLPYLTAGYLTVRGQGANVAIRETAAEPSRGVATEGAPER